MNHGEFLTDSARAASGGSLVPLIAGTTSSQAPLFQGRLNPDQMHIFTPGISLAFVIWTFPPFPYSHMPDAFSTHSCTSNSSSSDATNLPPRTACAKSARSPTYRLYSGIEIICFPNL
jgi:hypothetical protein